MHYENCKQMGENNNCAVRSRDIRVGNQRYYFV